MSWCIDLYVRHRVYVYTYPLCPDMYVCHSIHLSRVIHPVLCTLCQRWWSQDRCRHNMYTLDRVYVCHPVQSVLCVTLSTQVYYYHMYTMKTQWDRPVEGGGEQGESMVELATPEHSDHEEPNEEVWHWLTVLIQHVTPPPAVPAPYTRWLTSFITSSITCWFWTGHYRDQWRERKRERECVCVCSISVSMSAYHRNAYSWANCKCSVSSRTQCLLHEKAARISQILLPCFKHKKYL